MVDQIGGELQELHGAVEMAVLNFCVAGGARDFAAGELRRIADMLENDKEYAARLEWAAQQVLEYQKDPTKYLHPEDELPF